MHVSTYATDILVKAEIARNKRGASKILFNKMNKYKPAYVRKHNTFRSAA
jgi:hypothetical protein